VGTVGSSGSGRFDPAGVVESSHRNNTGPPATARRESYM
jgi:hypothetical protein